MSDTPRTSAEWRAFVAAHGWEGVERTDLLVCIVAVERERDEWRGLENAAMMRARKAEASVEALREAMENGNIALVKAFVEVDALTEANADLMAVYEANRKLEYVDVSDCISRIESRRAKEVAS